MAGSKYQIILLLISFSTLSGANYGINPTIVYKEHRIIGTEQLCPDLQDSTAKDIDTANYPYKSVFRLAGQVWKSEDPCVFESRGPRNQYTTVVIKAIQTGYQSWNYTGSRTCSEHIKLRLPTMRDGGYYYRTGLPLCTVTKPSNPNKPSSQNPFYHPHVWQLSKHRMGISFLVPDNDNATSSGDKANSTLNPVDDQENSQMSKFIYVVFASFFGDTCSLRVQQYLVDPMRETCNKGRGTLFTLCGMYNCSEDEKILKQAGFWSDALRLSEIHKLIDVMRRKQYRSTTEPSFMDFLISLMRLMIMPVVFFVAYYVTRQLREKLANRQLLLHSRNSTFPINPSTFGGPSRVGISVPESPSSARPRFEDPPPAYCDTLISPPSYLEATLAHKPPENVVSPSALDSTSNPECSHNENTTRNINAHQQSAHAMTVDVNANSAQSSTTTNGNNDPDTSGEIQKASDIVEIKETRGIGVDEMPTTRTSDTNAENA